MHERVTTLNEILKLLKEIHAKKTVGFDMILKLVKTTGYVLRSPLSKAINNSLL